jgi:hypothetical protein
MRNAQQPLQIPVNVLLCVRPRRRDEGFLGSTFWALNRDDPPE